MGKNSTNENGKGKDAKEVIYCRIDPKTVLALDAIAESMAPKPSRAQLIDLACAEYVERHSKGRGKAGG